MARGKTKRASMDTTCTQDESGNWSWTTGLLEWVWLEGRMGINLLLKQGDQLKGAAFFKTLNEAVCFSWGFKTGLDAPRKAE